MPKGKGGKNMKIIEALQNEINIRVSVGNKWLYRANCGTYIVMEHKHGKHKSTVLTKTNDEDYAVEILLKEERI